MLPEIAVFSTIVYCSGFQVMGRKRSLPTRKSQDTLVTGLNSAFKTNTQHSQVFPAGQGRRGEPRKEPHLINEVQCHSPLPYFHLFGFPVFSVLIPDFIYTLLQPPSCLVLLPVLLTLQGSWNRVSTREQAEDQLQSASQGFASPCVANSLSVQKH